MPALVKSSSSLATGNLVLLRQEVAVESASEIRLNAEYCCLPAYADRWSQQLRVGAPTPLPAPTAINYYNLLSPLSLSSVSQNISQGLCYFSCTFNAPRDATTPVDATNPTAPQFETTVTSVVQEQSLSGSYRFSFERSYYDKQTREWIKKVDTGTRNWAFEYSSEEITITAASEELMSGDAKLYINPETLFISKPRWKTYPLRGGKQDGEGLGIYYRTDFVQRREKSVSSNGKRRYSLSLQKIYEVIPANYS